ncbi:MAG: hypothetical protein M3N14_09990 [Bacteroidota bacterium]|nr:hypothetical protein [Bacteroidota bacterium]
MKASAVLVPLALLSISVILYLFSYHIIATLAGLGFVASLALNATASTISLRK